VVLVFGSRYLQEIAYDLSRANTGYIQEFSCYIVIDLDCSYVVSLKLGLDSSTGPQ